MVQEKVAPKIRQKRRLGGIRTIDMKGESPVSEEGFSAKEKPGKGNYRGKKKKGGGLFEGESTTIFGGFTHLCIRKKKGTASDKMSSFCWGGRAGTSVWGENCPPIWLLEKDSSADLKRAQKEKNTLLALKIKGTI